MGMWQIPRRHRQTHKQRKLPKSLMPSRWLPQRISLAAAIYDADKHEIS